MQRRLSVAMATAAVAAGVAAPALAASHHAAQKEPLFDNPIPSCTGPTGGTAGKSFAIIKQNGNGAIMAVVHLHNAQPNSTYTVFLQTDPNCNFIAQTDITTNRKGNGNGHLSGTDPTATGALVFTFDTSGDELQTPIYTFGSK